MLIVGDADSVISLERFQQYLADIPEPKQYQVVSGADHFWWGCEEEVAQIVTQFFNISFSQVQPS